MLNHIHITQGEPEQAPNTRVTYNKSLYLCMYVCMYYYHIHTLFITSVLESVERFKLVFFLPWAGQWLVLVVVSWFISVWKSVGDISRICTHTLHPQCKTTFSLAACCGKARPTVSDGSMCILALCMTLCLEMFHP